MLMLFGMFKRIPLDVCFFRIFTTFLQLSAAFWKHRWLKATQISRKHVRQTLKANILLCATNEVETCVGENMWVEYALGILAHRTSEDEQGVDPITSKTQGI